MIFFKKSLISKAVFGLCFLLLITLITLLPISKVQNDAQADESLSFSEFQVPTSQSAPNGITSGPDGNMWFTENDGEKIGRITPNGTITEYAIPKLNSDAAFPSQIISGPDGNLWFTGTNQIGRITPNGTITQFPIPSYGSAPFGIAAGPDGNLWFASDSNVNNTIMRITPNGQFTQFPIPTSDSGASYITKGPDGNLWFTEQTANKIGRITPSGVFTEFPIPTNNSAPVGITTGPDGNIWFTEYTGHKIGRITTTGVITEFAIPTTTSDPGSITSATDGNLWFTELSGNKIGRVTPNGSITEFTIPTDNSGPDNIAVSPDGKLWFTQYNTDNIGRITLSGTTALPTPTPTPKIINLPIHTFIFGFIHNSFNLIQSDTNITITCNGASVNTTTDIVGYFYITTGTLCPAGSSVSISAALGVPYLPGSQATGSGTIQTGGNVGTITLSAPVLPQALEAVSWALSQTTNNDGLAGPVNLYLGDNTTEAWGIKNCLPFVSDAWKVAGVDIGGVGSNGTAKMYWDQNPKHFPKHPETSYTVDTPPAGALVFWDSHTINNITYPSHVAISTGIGQFGNDEIVSSPTDYTNLSVHTLLLSQRPAAMYNYLGWMMP